MLSSRLEYPNKFQSGWEPCHTRWARKGVSLDVQVQNSPMGLRLFFEAILGQGAFGRVMTARCNCDGEKSVAIKLGRPDCLRHEHAVLQHLWGNPSLDLFLCKPIGLVAPSFSSMGLVMHRGPSNTLQDLINTHKANRSQVPEAVVHLLTLDMVCALAAVHACHVLHGDLKPDNWLISFKSSKPEVRLVDFGASAIVPPAVMYCGRTGATTFRHPAMDLGKPWGFEADLFGLGACIHCMLHGEYLDLSRPRKLRRYWNSAVWTSVLNALLYPPSCLTSTASISVLTDVSRKLRQHFQEK